MARKVDRRDVVRGIGAVGLLGLAGCAADEGTDEPDDGGDGSGDGGSGDGGSGGDDSGDGGSGGPDQLRVGVLQPVTGDLGDLGEPIANAGELPATQLETADIPFDIDVRVEDTETNPEVGVNRAQTLADAGYPSITGAASSSVTIQVALDVLFEEEVVGISPASTSPEITELDGRFLLRVAPTDALQGVAAARLAVEEQDLQTAGTFYLNNAYGQGLNDAFVSNFEELGGDVLAQSSFEPEQPSYDSALGTVLSDQPDLLYVVGYPASGEQIFRDFYENFDAGQYTVIVADGMQSNDLPGNVDNPMENVLGTAPAAVGPGRETFDTLFQDEFGAEPGVFTAQAYDATAVHMLAQARAGELSGPAVADEVRPVTDSGGEVVTPENLAEGLRMAAEGQEVEYRGASSTVEFDENGDLAAATFDIFQFSADGYTVTDQVEL
jgi:ABC-type branched-subunit amino acid transport system substrate-binding protein